MFLVGTGIAPGGRLGKSPPPCCLFLGLFCGMFCSSSSSASGGGIVLGTSQSSVGGTTHLSDLRSNTSMAGHLWRRGYPPWHCQYLLQDLPNGTLPFGSSLQRAETTIITEEVQGTWKQLTMFLASVYILGPVTGVGAFVVQKSTDAQLFCGGAVPACPISCARSLVSEDAVQPVAVLGSNWGIWKFNMQLIQTSLFLGNILP